MTRGKATETATIQEGTKTPAELRQEQLSAMGAKWLEKEGENAETVAKALEVVRPYVKPIMDGLGVAASATEAKYASQVYVGHMSIFGELIATSEVFRVGLESLALQNGVLLTGKTMQDRLYQYVLASQKGRKVCPISHSDEAWRFIAAAAGLTLSSPAIIALRNVFHKLGVFLGDMGYRQRKPSAKTAAKAETKAETAKAETAKAETTPPSAEVVISKEITPASIVEGVVGQTKFSLLDLIRESVVAALVASNDVPEWVSQTFNGDFIDECVDIAFKRIS